MKTLAEVYGTEVIDGVEYLRGYGCFDRKPDHPCYYHLERPANRVDPRCQGCRHQLRPWREKGRYRVGGVA